MHRMQDPEKYRLWKAEVVQQTKNSSSLSATAWKVLSWALLAGLTLTAIALAIEPTQQGIVSSIHRSASSAWDSHFPHTQLSAWLNCLPVFHSSSTQTQAEGGFSASDTLFPEIKREIEALSSKDNLQESQTSIDSDFSKATDQPSRVSEALFPEIKHDVEALSSKVNSHDTPEVTDSSTNSMWSLFKLPAKPPETGSRAEHVNWPLENSLLRAAELESDLASMRSENQQLSAHLLSAARQLAAVGQPVHLPQDGQSPVSTASKLVSGSKAAAAMLGLSLAALIWAVVALRTGCPRCKEHVAEEHFSAEQVSSHAYAYYYEAGK